MQDKPGILLMLYRAGMWNFNDSVSDNLLTIGDVALTVAGRMTVLAVVAPFVILFFAFVLASDAIFGR